MGAVGRLRTRIRESGHSHHDGAVADIAQRINASIDQTSVRGPRDSDGDSRDRRSTYFAGNSAFTLTDPDGRIYVMQSYTQAVDPGLHCDALSSLGKRPNLPEGWSCPAPFRCDDLILGAQGSAQVVANDFRNAYQLADVTVR